jgi:hypothetical protein
MARAAVAFDRALARIVGRAEKAQLPRALRRIARARRRQHASPPDDAPLAAGQRRSASSRG